MGEEGYKTRGYKNRDKILCLFDPTQYTANTNCEGNLIPFPEYFIKGYQVVFTVRKH